MTLHRFHRVVFIIAIVFYAVVAWFANGYYHADEQFQIIEFAGLKTGFNQPSDLAWEYDAGIRPALQPTVAYVLIEVFNLFTGNPYVQAFLLRLLTAFMALLAIRFLLLRIITDYEVRYQKLLVLTSYFLWFIPLIFTRFSSEAWSAIFLIYGLGLVLKTRTSYTNIYYWKLGLLLGIAFLFRFQSSLVSLGLLGWLFFVKAHEFKQLSKSVAAVGIMAALGILLDSWFYKDFTLAAFNYIDYGFFERSITAGFDTKPILWYFYALIKYPLLPIGVLVCLAFLYLILKHPKSIYLWCVAPIFAVHCFIPHKEIRFLFPIAFLAAPVLVFFIQSIQQDFNRTFKSSWKLIPIATIVVGIITIITNTIGLVAITSKTAGEPIIHNGHYINNNYPVDAVTLYHTNRASPYEPFGIPLNFYRQENVFTKQVESFCDLTAEDLSGNGVALLSFAMKDQPETSCLKGHDSIRFTKLTQSWPDWLRLLDTYYTMYNEPQQSFLYKMELKR